ncbi:MAG: GlxA family transcriptional regulator [Hyphomicrobiales bacterium]
MARRSDDTVETIGFLLVPGFALMSYAAAVEPLRAANVISGRTLYRWVAITVDGRPATSSAGAIVPSDTQVGDRIDLDMLIVCAAGNPAEFRDRATFAWLRSLARKGLRIAGVSGGPYLLARAGLMQGRRMTVHWEHAPALAESHPDLLLTRSLYVIDGDRLTCAGGIAPLDMMHALIAERMGEAFARRVSDWFLHTDIRPPGGAQRASLIERYGVFSRQLVSALEFMEGHIGETASRAAVARHAGISTRQLDRLFRTHMQTTFAEHYRAIRLERARDLLVQTTLPVTEVALAAGFASASHFSRLYSAAFGHAPSRERTSGIS